jgi:hypothetical protein
MCISFIQPPSYDTHGMRVYTCFHIDRPDSTLFHSPTWTLFTCGARQMKGSWVFTIVVRGAYGVIGISEEFFVDVIGCSCSFISSSPGYPNPNTRSCYCLLSLNHWQSPCLLHRLPRHANRHLLTAAFIYRHLLTAAFNIFRSPTLFVLGALVRCTT